MDCVIVGVDGSADAEAALRWAAAFAAASGAQLVGVHARGLLDHDRRGARVPAVSASASDARRAADSWGRLTGHLGLPGDLIVRDGDPVSVLLDAQDTEQADLIVVGRRGAGASASLIGSTSSQVAQEANCPVVVVPPRS
jgi:nucleotide-binding universal stress UspA family protein